MNGLILSARLKKIAYLTQGSETLADVGCDHGYVPIYCVANGLCQKAIAMDVNQGPLLRCEKNIEKYNLSDKIKTRLSNGINSLAYGEVDTIVIAGMGGLLIRDILASDKNKIADGTTLILQPMLAPVELRLYLYENGFLIEDEYIERETNKFYNIFKVKKVRSNIDCTYDDLIVGKNLKLNSFEYFEDYINYKISVVTKIINGMKSASEMDEELFENYQKQLECYKKSLG